MNAILEFNLPEDQEQFNVASKATELFLTLYEFDQKLRTLLKYHQKLTGEEYAVVDKLRDDLHTEMHENGINLNMMS